MAAKGAGIYLLTIRFAGNLCSQILNCQMNPLINTHDLENRNSSIGLRAGKKLHSIMSSANSAVSKVGPRTFSETKEWMQLAELSLCVFLKVTLTGSVVRQNHKTT